MKKILESYYNYTLYKDKNRLLLTVICGTVAVFDLTMELNKEEHILFDAQGEAFIVALASKVCYAPTDFLERRIL